MKFASRENSEAEQRALMAEIVATFDAIELKPHGMDRARQLADQCEDLEPVLQPSEGEEITPWVQPLLFEDAA